MHLKSRIGFTIGIGAALALMAFAAEASPRGRAHQRYVPAYDQYRTRDGYGNGANGPVLIRPYWDNGYFRNF